MLYILQASAAIPFQTPNYPALRRQHVYPVSSAGSVKAHFAAGAAHDRSLRDLGPDRRTAVQMPEPLPPLSPLSAVSLYMRQTSGMSPLAAASSNHVPSQW